MEEYKKKIKECFKGLTFVEDTHSYFLNGDRLKLSVSGVVKKFTEEADWDLIALTIDKKEGLPPGTTSKIWKYNSDAACAIGNKAHYFGELYPFHRNLKPTDGYQEAIVKFWEELPDFIIPVFTELTMYHKKYKFGGMKDITLFDTRSNTFIIGDYKTNKDLHKNHGGQTLTGPFSFMLDTPFNKYQIQFSLYQILFEQTGYKVSQRKLVWIKPNGTYELMDTADLTESLNNYLEQNIL